MTPDEVELLQGVGQMFLQNIGVIVTASILYGLYLAIFAFGIRALLKRRPRTRYTWILFGLLSALFLVSTANLAVSLAYVIASTQGYLINNPEKPLLDRIQLSSDSTTVLAVWLVWLGGSNGSGFLFIFADAVVVWRACVLWPDNKIARYTPLALLVLSIASVIVSATIDTLFTIEAAFTSSDLSGILLILSQSLSAATNIVATALIGFKAYQHRQMIKANMAMQSTKAGPILVFLTESGVAFCVIQIITLVIGADDDDPVSALADAVFVWQEIMVFAAAVYPVLILLIVDSHGSISDHTEVFADSGVARNSKTGSLGVGTHVSFAVRPGIASSGSVTGADTMMGSRIDPGACTDYAKLDLEKGEALDTASLTGNDGILHSTAE